jgi:murein DD-endopeptidase MepM/ murein hydrolase activator NlpD
MRFSYRKRRLAGVLALCLALLGGILAPLSGGRQALAASPSPLAAQAYGPYYVLSPVYGGWSGDEKWYNVSGSPLHKPFATFDDTYAYDLNLPSNRENQLPVYSSGYGRVTSLGTTYPGTTDGGTYGAVLIDHQNGIFTGYMHMRNIQVRAGDSVTPNTIIGYISDRGVPGVVHLHFAFYLKVKKNGKDYLSSTSAYIGPRDFGLSLPPSLSLRRGASYQVSAPVPFPGFYSRVEDQRWYNNTYWTSSNSHVATVSGSGLVKAVATGSSTITLKFSGKTFNIPINVTN